jgi:hypothetical protein
MTKSLAAPSRWSFKPGFNPCLVSFEPSTPSTGTHLFIPNSPRDMRRSANTGFLFLKISQQGISP